LCGDNVYSLMDKHDLDPIMSKTLLSDFCEWRRNINAVFRRSERLSILTGNLSMRKG
jgi:hypothetical protein